MNKYYNINSPKITLLSSWGKPKMDNKNSEFITVGYKDLNEWENGNW